MANKITTLNQLQSTAEAAKKYAGGLVSELATTTLEAIEEVSDLKQDKITSGTSLIPPGSAWKTDTDPDYPNYVDSLPSIPALTANDRVDIIITESTDKAIAVKCGFSPVITLNSSNKPVIRAKDKPGGSEMIMSAKYMITKGAGKYGTLTYGQDEENIPLYLDFQNGHWETAAFIQDYPIRLTVNEPLIKSTDTIIVTILPKRETDFSIIKAFHPIVTPFDGGFYLYNYKREILAGSISNLGAVEATCQIVSHTGSCGYLNAPFDFAVEETTVEDLHGNAILPIIKNTWKEDTSFDPYKYSYTTSISSIKATDTVLAIASAAAINSDAISLASKMQISPIAKPSEGKLTFYAMSNPESVDGNTVLSYNWKVLNHTGSCGAFIFPMNLPEKKTVVEIEKSAEPLQYANIILEKGIDNCEIYMIADTINMNDQYVKFRAQGYQVTYGDSLQDIKQFLIMFGNGGNFLYNDGTAEIY